jgi:hypothetical protein
VRRLLLPVAEDDIGYPQGVTRTCTPASSCATPATTGSSCSMRRGSSSTDAGRRRVQRAAGRRGRPRRPAGGRGQPRAAPALVELDFDGLFLREVAVRPPRRRRSRGSVGRDLAARRRLASSTTSTSASGSPAATATCRGSIDLAAGLGKQARDPGHVDVIVALSWPASSHRSSTASTGRRGRSWAPAGRPRAWASTAAALAGDDELVIVDQQRSRAALERQSTAASGVHRPRRRPGVPLARWTRARPGGPALHDQGYQGACRCGWRAAHRSAVKQQIRRQVAFPGAGDLHLLQSGPAVRHGSGRTQARRV